MKNQASKKNPIYDPLTDRKPVRAPVGVLMIGVLSCAGIYLVGLLIWWAIGGCNG